MRRANAAGESDDQTAAASTSASVAVEGGTSESRDCEEAYQGKTQSGSFAATSLQSTRTPLTSSVSQVDADLALARALQEQERVFMVLRVNGHASGDVGWESGSYSHDSDVPYDVNDVGAYGEEYDGTLEVDGDGDAFDVYANIECEADNNSSIEQDQSTFSSDEAYARALQDAERLEMTTRLLALAGIPDRGEDEHPGYYASSSQGIDPDELSYEEMLALGEAIGTESRGLSADKITSLPCVIYKMSCSQGGNELCVICQVEYQDGDSLTALSCKHSYHAACLQNWLQINKVCPVCTVEVDCEGR